MIRYDNDAKEAAYDLHKLQGLSFSKVIEKMRETYPGFSKNTLTAWKNDADLDWDGRHKKFCQALAKRRDKDYLVKFKPINETIKHVREKLYNQIVAALDKNMDIVTDKNLGYILTAFAKLADIELKMTAKGDSGSSIPQVINVIFLILEKDPGIGPLLKTRKNEIVDAIYTVIKADE